MDWSTRGSLSFIISWNLLKFMSTELLMPSNHLILCHLLLILPSVFPRIMVFSNESIFTSGGQSTEASAAVSSLPKDVQGWFPMGLTGWSPCSPRDSQESSSVPHFESFNSSALSLLYGPALTSIYDYCKNHQFSSVQLLSHVCRDCSTPAFPVHHQLLELTQMQVHQISDAIQPSHPLSAHSPPAFNLAQHQGLFSWKFFASGGFSISLSNEYSGLISFRMDWLDLLAVQGTLKTLLQHHSSKASILRGSVFLTVQLSHTHMTIRKTIALTRWTFVGKVMSLLYNMLSRLIIAFLPRSKHLLISWLQWF